MGIRGTVLPDLDLDNASANWTSLKNRIEKKGLKTTFVIIYNGQLKGASLSWFVQKRSSGGKLRDWYERKDCRRIEHYIKDEAARFIHAYKFLKQHLPKLYELYEPLP